MVEDIRDAMMEYQVCPQTARSPPYLTSMPDVVTARSLREDLSAHCEFHSLTARPQVVTGKQERADLALLNQMYHAADAGYLCGDRKGCMKGTRRDVLSQLESWLNDERDKRVFWLNGLAGTGKSTIAQTFAEITFADGMLGASFFCSRDYDDRSNLRRIFPTVAFQLARRYPRFREELLPVLAANPDVGRETLCSQMEKLIVHPFEETQIPTLIIIDALDECRDEEPASALLSVLSRYLDKISFVKVLITGRPEPRIRSGFRLESLRPHTEVLRLQDVEKSLVDGDIRLFFKTQLTAVAKNRSDCDLAEDWPSFVDLDILCTKAAGLFIYASTVIKFVASKDHQPSERLAEIVALPQSTVEEGRSGLDQLYTEVLQQAFLNIWADDGKFYSHLKSVVGAVILIFNPLSVTALSDLLGASNISTALRSLHSLLIIPTSQLDSTPIRVLHKSFPDFLTNSKRCRDKQFFIDPSIYHRNIMLSCLRLMKERLKKNICQLGDYSLCEVEDLTVQRTAYIGDALEYACCFWASHLAKTASSHPHDEEVLRAIDGFFKTCFLFWIEVLSLMRKLDIGVYALNEINQWYMIVSYLCRTHESLLMFIQIGISCKWTNDSQHFLLENFDKICDSPSLIYQHALPFCPSSSWLQKYYSGELSQVVKVVRRASDNWGTCSRTVTLDGEPQVLSYSNNTIAVGLSLKSDNIIFLDATTGSPAAVLSSHTDQVTSLVFSLNERFLVSGSNDKTVKLWDVQTGGVVKTFQGHTNYVISVSISADCTKIASGSQDKSICLWDIHKGECCHSIKLEGWGNHVYFSLTNSESVVCISGGKFQKWNINDSQIESTCNASQITFSPDHTQFALCNENGITIKNSDSGAPATEFQLPDINFAECCCFSPDGSHIAVGSSKIVCVWNIIHSVPHHIATFAGHAKDITSLVFTSPSSLISASRDKSVKLWQIESLSTDQAANDLKPTQATPSSIEFVSLQAKEGIAISGDSNGVVRIWDISTGLCKTSFQTPARNKFCGDAQMIDGRLLFIWGLKDGIHIWDSEQGELPQKSNSVHSSDLRISGDGSKVFDMNWSKSVWRIQARSILSWELTGEVELEGGSNLLYFLDQFCADGSKVWVQSTDSTIKGWDFKIPGSSPIPLPNSSPERPYLDFVDGAYWMDGPPFIKNTVTGREVFGLSGKYAEPHKAQWDGQYLISGYEDGEVLILDFKHLCSPQ